MTLVKLLRRILAALMLAAAIAASLRLRGTGGTPPQRGGWRQLQFPPEPGPGRGSAS